MWQEPSLGPAQGLAKGLRLLVGAAFGCAIAGAAVAGPQDRDPSLRRMSDHGRFQVQIASDSLPIPMNRIHTWTLRVADPDGRPINGTNVAVTGGMPEHGHGLPTQPRVVSTEASGFYTVMGMRFSMTGWWVLNLDIRTPDGRADTVTFNITL